MKIKNDSDCAVCGTKAIKRTCAECGTTALITDCGHFRQPRPIAAGRADGSRHWEDFCADCAAQEDDEREEATSC